MIVRWKQLPSVASCIRHGLDAYWPRIDGESHFVFSLVSLCLGNDDFSTSAIEPWRLLVIYRPNKRWSQGRGAPAISQTRSFGGWPRDWVLTSIMRWMRKNESRRISTSNSPNLASAAVRLFVALFPEDAEVRRRVGAQVRDRRRGTPGRNGTHCESLIVPIRSSHVVFLILDWGTT